ncbi:polymorphic toxin type 15 domain-containing protein [Cellulomonas sp. NPDC055163]
MTVTPTQCVADGGLINPAAFPAKSADLDPDKVRVSAASVKTMGTSVQDETSSIATSWNGLTHSYEAPEQQRVYDLMRPAVTSANQLRTAFHTMAGHLETYATALAGIKPRLASFEQRAAAFRAEVVNGVQVDASSSNEAGFGDYAKGAVDWIPGVDERQVTVPWYEDGDTVQRNKDLLAEYAELLEDVSTASAQCANDINRLVTNMCVTPVEAIPAEAFTNPAQPMPWGEPREEDRNCPESVGSGTYTFGKDLLQGAGQLVLGYNPETGGWFEGKAYGQAWGGLGDLVGSIALFATPVAWVGIGMQATGHTDNDFVRFMDDRYDTVVGGLGSLIGYDHGAEDGWHKWKEDGVAAGTGAVLSIGTFFIPGAGQVGAGLKAGSVGAKVARIAAAGSEFVVQGGSWVVKGGIRLASGLRQSLVLGGDLMAGGFRGPALAGAGAAGGGVRLSLTGLVNAVGDSTPSHVVPHRTPVSGDLFPSTARGGSGATPGGSGATPGGGGATPGGGGAGHGTGGGSSPLSNGHAPEWNGPTRVNGRPDVRVVPQEHWGNPELDPAHPHYDAVPRGQHGNVGTIDPDTISPSGLTNSGRLLHPALVPDQLQPFVDRGVVVIDDGVLRMAEPIEVTFTRTNPNHDAAEFARQGRLQQQSVNQQSVADWNQRMSNYDTHGRTDEKFQGQYRRAQIRLMAEGFMREGVGRRDAFARARTELANEFALHGPDQRGGGNPRHFTGLGEGGVNSAYGWGWGAGRNAETLRLELDAVTAESGIPPHLLGDVRMNVRIRVVDAVAASGT